MEKIKITTIASAFFIVIICFFINLTLKRKQNGTATQNSSSKDLETDWLKDWQNYEEIEKALHMKGLGEVGKAANISEYRKELYDKYGFDAMLSDYISLQRSVPDMRTKACKNITYLANLPRSAIIIIFYNERLSVLLRTVYSILNRTPTELLQEIILVDDGSTWSDMQEELEQNLRIHFSTKTNKVRLIRQSTRTGLMVARMAGARNASKEAEVLIFLDSHFEVGYNWLPPLLEPIVINPRTCTCPIIDRIAFDTFAYMNGGLSRGFFDYTFNYRMVAPTAEMYAHPEKNFKNYIMMGGAMAIGSDFFWKLGGFDEGMTHWGGEQFEMSFKIWMCGGQLLDVPCSRMGHLFRDFNTNGNRLLYGDYEFCNRNYKRILDVWIDEKNRNYFLEKRSSLNYVEAGDLVERHAIRDRLQCKNFSWMIENVMTDLHNYFLPVGPFDLASGLLRSLHSPTLCMVLGADQRAKLQPCTSENDTISQNMHWQYSWRGELRILNNICLESDLRAMSVGSYICHQLFGNQKWFYDRETKWIIQPKANFCMLANVERQRVQLAACNVENTKLKWIFSNMNQSEMDRWEEKLKT